MNAEPSLDLELVDNVDSLGDDVLARSWHYASVALAPETAVRGRQNRGFERRVLVARSSGRPAGMLTLLRCRSRRFPASIFDPRAVAPGVFGATSADAGDFLLVGGATDLVAGPVLAADVDDQDRRRIAGELVDAAFDHARATDLVPAALYVRDEDHRYFDRGGRAVARIDTFASLVVGDADEQLAGLSRNGRSMVRRERAAIERHGLGGSVVPAADVVAEAAPLIVAVKRRHDVPDHPRLADMRLRAWAAAEVGERLAFTVRGPSGGLLAVAFGCRRGAVLEMHEVGLAESEHRHLAYVESLIHAPLRHAHTLGCTEVHLGLGSPRPKESRGARLSPVWAIGVSEGTVDK